MTECFPVLLMVPTTWRGSLGTPIPDPARRSPGPGTRVDRPHGGKSTGAQPHPASPSALTFKEVKIHEESPAGIAGWWGWEETEAGWGERMVETRRRREEILMIQEPSR